MAVVASSTDPEPNGYAGMAGIGAGRSGGSMSYLPYASAEQNLYSDTSSANSRTQLHSSQSSDPSYHYGGLSSAQSVTFADAQTRTFDATNPPFSSAMYTSQSMQQLPHTNVHSTTAVSTLAVHDPSPTSSSHHRGISEAELLAFVDQQCTGSVTDGTGKRPQHSGAADRKNGSGTTSSLDTLDLCHKRITRVPDALADMIKDQVVRLALGYNYLTRLPDNFPQLHGLRYLNVRANNFAHFPECVTKMPNLEILDLSRNKVRNLPQNPGRLLALRVLSMNANRLTELPEWVGKMKHLRILKLDSNPLEWPPPHISKMPNVAPPKPPSSSNSSSAAEREKAKRFEDRQMLVWIAKLRSWINDPINHPQSLAASESEAQLSIVQEGRADSALDRGIDSARTSEDIRTELPASQSDGLMSLRVQVPESVSDRTLRADTPDAARTLQMPLDTVAAMSDEIAPRDAEAVASGLLPPLVPQASATLAAADAPSDAPELNFSASRDDVTTAAESSQHFARSSRSPSTSSTEHSDRPIAAIPPRLASDDTEARQHARNNSHSVAQDIAATHQIEARRSLKAKKSLPDLRKSHEAILQERRDVHAEQSLEASSDLPAASTEEPSRVSHSQLAQSSIEAIAAAPSALPSTQPHEGNLQSAPRKTLLQIRRGPRPTLGNGLVSTSRLTQESGTHNVAQQGAGQIQGGGLRKLSLPTVGATQAAAEAAAAALAARAGYGPTPPRFDVGHGRMASDRGEGNWPSRSASPTVNGSRNAADQERNSYFRRLSTLPSSTISKAVPVPVLKFVDGTRGVLFALSQIHAAIGQFMTPVIDERISSQFHRLLDISNGSVANLINALDRFDSLSRRGTPDPGVIRGVLVTCKDSVITFRKLVSVLQLQLRALQSSSDVRYARTLLLMLYGSMAEVSNSWTEMAPLVEAVQPYLTQGDAGSSSPASSDAVSSVATPFSAVAERATPPSTRAGTLLQKSMSSTSNGSAPTLPSIAEATTPMRAGSRPYIARGPSRRRHAGSFSAQDLAQGAAMTPSNSNQPPFNLEDLQATSAYNTPARGARSRRQGSLGNSASSAATFAQSEGSDRSAVLEGTQSTAPSTPGGSVLTGASQRVLTMTPGTISTPTSSRPKRSGSNGSSAVDTSVVTPRSQATTPATPATGAAKRNQHVATPSSATAPATAAASGPAAAGSRLHMAVSDPKMTVDDHLLEMLDNITKLSARVWSLLFEHLRSAGVDAKSAGSPEVSPLDAPERAENTDIAKSTAIDGEQDVPETTHATASTPDEESVKKLRELRDLAQVTDDLTSQLRSTYLRAREEEQRRSSIDGHSPPTDPPGLDMTTTDEPTRAAVAPSPDNISQATVAKLFDESHQFVRAIVNTSTQIKAISVAHEFPREVRRLLGQVAQACSNLTVYLLWLSPTAVS